MCIYIYIYIYVFICLNVICSLPHITYYICFCFCLFAFATSGSPRGEAGGRGAFGQGCLKKKPGMSVRGGLREAGENRRTPLNCQEWAQRAECRLPTGWRPREDQNGLARGRACGCLPLRLRGRAVRRIGCLADRTKIGGKTKSVHPVEPAPRALTRRPSARCPRHGG